MARKKILLPEYDLDKRITEAADRLAADETLEIIQPSTITLSTEEVSAHLATKKHFHELSPAEQAQSATDPLIRACVSLDRGDVDGVVAGAHYTTRDVLRAALRIIGPATGTETVSSSMLLTLPDERQLVFADCAVIARPTAHQLVEIAIASAESARICGISDPRAAFLSFSTHGSASCPSIDPIRDAAAALPDHPLYDGFAFDGDVQFDAALIPEIARKKAPTSTFTEQPATVFVFPNLHAANIAYKITERLANAQATGPLLQGFAKPINDLSRGASVDDIIAMCRFTAEQA